MNPDEFAYQQELQRSGLPISLNVHEAFRPSMNALLDLLGRSAGSIAQVVRLGRISTSSGDVLLVPNDPEVIRGLRLAASKLAGDPSVDMMLRVRAQDLDRLVQAAVAPVVPPPRRQTALPVASRIEPPAGCVRSPCDDWKDPKVTEIELAAARARVGTPKVAVDRPHAGMPLSVSYGIGVDSTAVLIGLAQLYDGGRRPEFRPDFITFGDTGGERDETYLYLEPMNAWLDSVGFPRVTIAAIDGGFGSRSYGSSRTLEQQCLVNHTMPSISQSKKSFAKCSKLWKQQAQNRWFKDHSGLFEKHGRSWALRPGVSVILKAIGYDADETNRERAGTFRTKDDPDSAFYAYWYPLMGWGWDRARCIAEIEAAGLSFVTSEGVALPMKSSCTYCGMAKKWEIDSLSKDKLLRALLIEEVAKRSRRRRFPKWLKHGPPKCKDCDGTGCERCGRRGTKWPQKKIDALKPLMKKYGEAGIPQNVLMALPGDLGNRGLGITFAWSDYALERGLVSQSELDEVIELAEAIIAEAPKRPGQWDASEGPVLSSTAAFTDVPGFRSLGGVFVGAGASEDEDESDEDE